MARDERRFSDEMGFFWEDAGGTRMAGRVLGALLIADPPEMSSSALTEFLGVSAGSVSTATRELIRPGLVERVRVAGERQDSFRATMDASVMPQFLHSRMELTRRLVQLIERGEKLAVHKQHSVRQQLADIREFWEFIVVDQAAAIERWEQRLKERAPDRDG